MRIGDVAKGAGAFLAGLAMLAAAADAAPGIVTQNINMRAGPGIDYPLVTQLPRGTATEIFGCVSGFEWCDVAVQDVRGWVAGAGLQLLYDDQPEPVLGYGAVVGIPLVGFDVDSYWGHHYRSRPWYHDVDRWHGNGPHDEFRGDPHDEFRGQSGGFRGQPQDGFHGSPPGGRRGPVDVAHPVGPTVFQSRPPEPGRPPELGRQPERSRMPAVITPGEPVRAFEPGPRPAPPAPRPGPPPVRIEQGPRPGPGPQGPPPGAHPAPGRPTEPHGGREPPP